MEQLHTQKIINSNDVLGSSFIDVRSLYLYCFQQFPSVRSINYIDGEKAFTALKEKYAANIRDIYTNRWYNIKRKKIQFDTTIIVLNENCIVWFDENYGEILHNGMQDELVNNIAAMVVQFKERQRRQPLEINLVILSNGILELKAMEIKRTKLDLDLFYEDDFKETNAVIQYRLKKNNDKGIVLLHGLPGTGKTTYLRYLVGTIKKRILFLSPSVAGNLMNPEFIELLVDNPNTVLIIEDAENIIMDRRFNNSSSVSNLLNISDGLLADFLNVQLICTFNSALTNIDSALLRKGRLIARYEFGKLGINKAQRLSHHFGYRHLINEPMTIAEIANLNEQKTVTAKNEIIGFRVNETVSE